MSFPLSLRRLKLASQIRCKYLRLCFPFTARGLDAQTPLKPLRPGSASVPRALWGSLARGGTQRPRGCRASIAVPRPAVPANPLFPQCCPGPGDS